MSVLPSGVRVYLGWGVTDMRRYLNRLGPYVVPGGDPEKPRADPSEAMANCAGLHGVRLHDVRHPDVAFGAGGEIPTPKTISVRA